MIVLYLLCIGCLMDLQCPINQSKYRKIQNLGLRTIRLTLWQTCAYCRGSNSSETSVLLPSPPPFLFSFIFLHYQLQQMRLVYVYITELIMPAIPTEGLESFKFESYASSMEELQAELHARIEVLTALNPSRQLQQVCEGIARPEDGSSWSSIKPGAKSVSSRKPGVFRWCSLDCQNVRGMLPHTPKLYLHLMVRPQGGCSLPSSSMGGPQWTTARYIPWYTKGYCDSR